MNNSYHSKAYHKYFEGYTEILEPAKNGKKKRIRRIYTASYFVQKGTDADWKRRKAIVAVLTLLILFCFVGSVIMPVESNATAWIVAFIGINIILLLLYLKEVVEYLMTKRKLTIGEYKDICKSMPRYSFILMIGLFATAFSKIGFLVYSGYIQGRRIRGFEIVSVVLLFCGATAALVLNRTEIKIKYERQENTVHLSQSGAEIFR